MRPAEISGDTASSESALLHAIHELGKEGVTPDTIVFLQCTSPFTTSSDIDLVVHTMRKTHGDSAFSARADHGFLWAVAKDGSVRGINHDSTQPRKRRQDVAPQYRETGAVYAMRTDAFVRDASRFCGRTVLVPLDSPSLEIDTPKDLAAARALCRQMTRVREQPSARIKVLVTDFDGVHTDDAVWLNEHGEETVRCCRADGLGLERLRNSGFALLIVSKEQNTVVSQRASKLHMEVLQQVDEKWPVLQKWMQDHGWSPEQVAFVGNDVTDVECMRSVGWSAAPADAHPTALAAAMFVCSSPGGHGALREVADALMESSHA